MIGIPQRYDLPHFSCVNSEVKLYNNKLLKYMATFNHVNILNISTERSQHTTHGLHLNKKGENLIANILVTEIKHIYSDHRTAAPIVLLWNVIENQNHTTCELDKIKDNIDSLNLENKHDIQLEEVLKESQWTAR